MRPITPCPKQGKPKNKRRNKIQRKSKFHAQDNPTKQYRQRPLEETVACANRFRIQRLANPTEAESAFAELLRQLGVEFEREHIEYYANQRRFLILDFYIAKSNIGFEIDGKGHALQLGYDRARDNWLATQGIRTIRFTNAAVLSNPQAVKEKVREIMVEKSPKTQ